MKNLFVSRLLLTLACFGCLIFSLIPNVPAQVQDRNSCQGDQEGWTDTNGTPELLVGKWLLVKSTNCRNGWKWSRDMTITSPSKGVYKCRVGGEPEGDVTVSGSAFTFFRDLSKLNLIDNNKRTSQTWKGSIQTDGKGGIRIYGTWSGAYDYLPKDEPDAEGRAYNLDFKMTKR